MWEARRNGPSYVLGLIPVYLALSRKFSDTSASLLTVTSTVPAIIQHLRDYYSANKTDQELVAKSQEDEQMKDKYRFTNGLLYFKGRLFIPQL